MLEHGESKNLSQMPADMPSGDTLVQNVSFYKRSAGIASLLSYLTERNLIRSLSGQIALELGCGDGSGLWALKCLGANPSGVDLQKYENLDSFKRSALIKGLPYFQGTSSDFLTSQPDRSADLICAFNTESAVWNDQVHDEAVRVLKSDGLVIISWQFVNLSTSDGTWPVEWPKWSGPKTRINLFDTIASWPKNRPIKRIVSPEVLEFGRVEFGTSLKLGTGDVTLPEAYVMIGKK